MKTKGGAIESAGPGITKKRPKKKSRYRWFFRALWLGAAIWLVKTVIVFWAVIVSALGAILTLGLFFLIAEHREATITPEERRRERFMEQWNQPLPGESFERQMRRTGNYGTHGRNAYDD